jgi:hypothetical protein
MGASDGHHTPASPLSPVQRARLTTGRSPNQPQPLLNVQVSLPIKKFIITQAKRFGISQGEFTRRVFISAIEEYVERGLYDPSSEK